MLKLTKPTPKQRPPYVSLDEGEARDVLEHITDHSADTDECAFYCGVAKIIHFLQDRGWRVEEGGGSNNEDN